MRSEFPGESDDFGGGSNSNKCSKTQREITNKQYIQCSHKLCMSLQHKIFQHKSGKRKS